MKLIIIAALNNNRVIGRNGKIPWHIPEDLQRFKSLTMGHVVLMGRKTYESIGKVLPGRRNVVVTSQNLPEVEHYHSLAEALTALAREEKVFVIGGGEIFRQTIGRADELLLTFVESDDEGDTLFPEDADTLLQKFDLVTEERTGGYSFQHYIRKQ
jgi:dihydrofolate reductase